MFGNKFETRRLRFAGRHEVPKLALYAGLLAGVLESTASVAEFEAAVAEGRFYTAEQHAIAERIPTALAGGLDQPACLIGPEIPAIRYFRLFAR